VQGRTIVARQTRRDGGKDSSGLPLAGAKVGKRLHETAYRFPTVNRTSSTSSRPVEPFSPTWTIA